MFSLGSAVFLICFPEQLGVKWLLCLDGRLELKEKSHEVILPLRQQKVCQFLVSDWIQSPDPCNQPIEWLTWLFHDRLGQCFSSLWQQLGIMKVLLNQLSQPSIWSLGASKTLQSVYLSQHFLLFRSSCPRPLCALVSQNSSALASTLCE